MEKYTLRDPGLWLWVKKLRDPGLLSRGPEYCCVNVPKPWSQYPKTSLSLQEPPKYQSPCPFVRHATYIHQVDRQRTALLVGTRLLGASEKAEAQGTCRVASEFLISVLDVHPPPLFCCWSVLCNCLLVTLLVNALLYAS